MLDAMRNRLQGIVVWCIVIVLGVAFVLVGTDFVSSGSSSSTAAKVNGQKIPWTHVDVLYERVSKQYGEKGEEKGVRDQLRMALIQRLALLSSAKDLGFNIGDDQVAKILLNIPDFQVDGKFSKERYLEVLSQASYNDALFRQQLFQDILLAQMEQGIAFSSFSLPSEVAQMVSLFDEKRDFGYLLISSKKFRSNINISEKELKEYYDSHPDTFVRPEQVAIDYVALSLNDLAREIPVKEEDLQQYYQAHVSSYSLPERVHVRHILIPISSSENPKDADIEANTKAQTILSKIRAGEDFASLARTYSADTGSAKEGGDLGWFTKGQMVPEFEKTAFGLNNPKEISSPVRTQFGYHIIQLLEKKEAQTRSYAEVRNLVKEQYQREKAQNTFMEKSEQLAKMAFEQASSLEPIAEALNLRIRSTEPFTKQNGLGIATNNPEVIKAAFSDEVLKNGNNSDPVKVDDNTLAVLRLKKHIPSEQLKFADVEKAIHEQLVNERSIEKAKTLMKALALRIAKGENPVTVAKSENLEWIVKTNISRQSKDMDNQLLLIAFEAPRPIDATKPGVKTGQLPSGDFAVLALKSIRAGNIAKVDDATRKTYRQSLAELYAQTEYFLYANNILKNTKIELMPYPER